MMDSGIDSSGSQRWLLKALREASGELHTLLMQALHDDSPQAEQLVEQAWRSEHIAAWQLGHLLFREVDEIPLHDFEWLEQARLPDCYQQLQEFIQIREQLSSVLAMSSEYEWRRSAPHRFQGMRNVESIARDLHRSDLEILNNLRAQLPLQ